MDIVLLVINFPDVAVARQIGTVLIQEQLAACVNLIPNIESIYQWQGKVHHDQECSALLKTTRDRYSEIEARLLELHPYENPELLMVPIEGGAKAYLQWVQDEVKPSGESA